MVDTILKACTVNRSYFVQVLSLNEIYIYYIFFLLARFFFLYWFPRGAYLPFGFILQVSNLLYVDQPTGTGFSYSSDKRDIRHNEDGVSNDLYDFLQVYFSVPSAYF